MAPTRIFRFDSLLQIRSAREDACKRTVAARLQKILGVRQKRAELEQQLREQTDGLRLCLAERRADLDHLRMSRHWISRLQLRILETESTLAAEQSILAQERAALAEARKQTRVLEILKERQRTAWLEAEGRREQRETDDMNAARHVWLKNGSKAGRDARPTEDDLG